MAILFESRQYCANMMRIDKFVFMFFRACIFGACVSCAYLTDAYAQSSKHYRMQVGCPFSSAKDIPDSMTLDELNKVCDLNEIKPNAPEHTVSVSETGIVKPEPIPIPPKSPSAAPDRRRFRAYDGRDIDGQDLRRIENTALKTCVQACKDIVECKAISFDKWNNFCFLKRGVSSGLRVEPKAIALVLSSIEPENDPRNVSMERFRRRKFLTSPYRAATKRNFEACFSSCQKDDKCEVFSYSKNDKKCSLIARPDEWFDDVAYDSGIKRQPPTQ